MIQHWRWINFQAKCVGVFFLRLRGSCHPCIVETCIHVQHLYIWCQFSQFMVKISLILYFHINHILSTIGNLGFIKPLYQPKVSKGVTFIRNFNNLPTRVAGQPRPGKMTVAINFRPSCSRNATVSRCVSKRRGSKHPPSGRLKSSWMRGCQGHSLGGGVWKPSVFFFGKEGTEEDTYWLRGAK